MKNLNWKQIVDRLRNVWRRTAGDCRFQIIMLCVWCPLFAVGLGRWNQRAVAVNDQRRFEEFRSGVAEPRIEEIRADVRREMEAGIAESLAESMAESVAEENRLPELSPMQREFLDRLSECMEFGRFQEAAELLAGNREQMWYLCHYVMRDRIYLYDGGRLYQDPDRAGLVLKSPSLIFYGDFAGGEPEGQCTALQAVYLEEPRYDYAEGQWENGRMNGPGTIGYCYYDGAGDAEEDQTVRRQGQFVHDRMEGAVRYETVNGAGEETVWDVTVKDGKLVLDQGWTYDSRKGLYYLLSDQSRGRAFVVSEKEAGETRFQNLLRWD